MLATEFEFELPLGYVDKKGNEHRTGIMRRATAADEIMPLRDPRVQENASYLSIIVLARVVTTLGTLERVDTKVIENLFTADLAFLQDMYRKINDVELPQQHLRCPSCGMEFNVPVNFTMGE
ncbi:MAG: phage tail assembly protein [Oscillospiraceae bacterium]